MATFITCGARHDTFPPVLIVQVSHLVVSSTNLEAEDWLRIFPLEKDLAFKSIAHVHCMSEWCFRDDLVHSSCENESDVLFGSVCSSSSPRVENKHLESHLARESHLGRSTRTDVLAL